MAFVIFFVVVIGGLTLGLTWLALNMPMPKSDDYYRRVAGIAVRRARIEHGNPWDGR